MGLWTAGIIAANENRRDECAALTVGTNHVDVVRVAIYELTRIQQRLERAPHLFPLLQARQRTHLDRRLSRIPHDHLCQPVDHCRLDVVENGARYEGATDRGAFLPSLDRHLGHQLVDIEIELWRSGRGVGPEDRAIQRVGLSRKRHRSGDYHWMGPKPAGRRRRTGERHRVLLGEVIEEVTRTSADELQRALRQEAGVQHQCDQTFGHICGGTCWFHKRRHAGEKRRCELLQRPPHREVERVDLDRDPGPRGIDMLADELTALAQWFDWAVDVHGGVGQLPASLAAIGEQHAESAVDVEHSVSTRGASTSR